MILRPAYQRLEGQLVRHQFSFMGIEQGRLSSLLLGLGKTTDHPDCIPGKMCQFHKTQSKHLVVELQCVIIPSALVQNLSHAIFSQCE